MIVLVGRTVDGDRTIIVMMMLHRSSNQSSVSMPCLNFPGIVLRGHASHLLVQPSSRAGVIGCFISWATRTLPRFHPSRKSVSTYCTLAPTERSWPGSKGGGTLCLLLFSSSRNDKLVPTSTLREGGRVTNGMSIEHQEPGKLT